MASSVVSPPRIVIIGGGLAGVSVAIRLLRQARAPLDIRLIDPQPFPGRGIAYSTRHPDHRLNAASLRHIIRADEPDHFPRFLEQTAPHDGWSPGQESFADAYPPRWLLGSYIEAELRDAVEKAQVATFVHVRGKAEDVARLDGGFLVTLADGAPLRADQVVLALGMFDPADRFAVEPVLARDGRYIVNPWARGAFDAVPKEGRVVLLGSHLTMMDSIVSLEAQGFRGQYSAWSRHGLAPGLSYMGPAWRDFLADGPLPRTARAFVRRLRIEVAAAAREGVVRDAVTSAIRPYIPALWAGASLVERRRFNRHFRARTLGHAAPPVAIGTVERVRAEGRFGLHAGQVVGVARQGDRLGVTVRPRGRDERIVESADAVINCTGSEYDWLRIADPLVVNLLRHGLVRPHPLRSGIDGDVQGRVADAYGDLADDLSAVGHPFHGGVHYESSASSALREQSIALVERLLRQLESDAPSFEAQGERA